MASLGAILGLIEGHLLLDRGAYHPIPAQTVIDNNQEVVMHWVACHASDASHNVGSITNTTVLDAS